MPDSSLSQAIVVVNTAVGRHGTEATRILFDHYRTSRREAQDAFVLALIGAVVTAHTMRQSPGARDPRQAEQDVADVIDQCEFEEGELIRLGLRKPRGDGGGAPSSAPDHPLAPPGSQSPPSGHSQDGGEQPGPGGCG